MNKVLERMLSRYTLSNSRDAVNAVREIIQEIALYGLWQGGFFRETAFYGGTALRILYGLDRYSEDMDFSLLKKDANFSFEPYREPLLNVLGDFGFDVQFLPRVKPSNGGVWSAFLKGDTLSHMMVIGIPEEIPRTALIRKTLKIKIEVDIDPPGGFKTERRPVLDPISYTVKVYERPSLFAGKMNAVLFRRWKKRVKGRDWYDMVWYLQNRIPVNLAHFEAKMRQSGDWDKTRSLSESDFIKFYNTRAAELDVEKALEDVIPFLRDTGNIEKVWSNDFFISLADKFTFLRE